MGSITVLRMIGTTGVAGAIRCRGTIAPWSSKSSCEIAVSGNVALRYFEKTFLFDRPEMAGTDTHAYGGHVVDVEVGEVVIIDFQNNVGSRVLKSLSESRHPGVVTGPLFSCQVAKSGNTRRMTQCCGNRNITHI